jgi:hypothetical protein
VSQQFIEPSFALKSFTCRSCKELAEQVWFNTYVERINNPAGVPLRIEGADLERLSQNPQFPSAVREQKVEYWNRINGGEVFLERWAAVQSDLLVAGMEISICSACMGTAIWLGGKMVHPKEEI